MSVSSLSKFTVPLASDQSAAAERPDPPSPPERRREAPWLRGATAQGSSPAPDPRDCRQGL